LQRHHGRLIISGSRWALLIGSIRPRGKRQRAGRPACRLGQVLAAITLLLQTAPGLHTFAVTGIFGYSITSSKKVRSPVVDPDTGFTTLAVDHHSNRLNYGFAVE
jgi:hypothetical protein